MLRARAAVLVVTGGLDAGRRAAIDSPTGIVVGTGELADLRLTDPTVSREHAHLRLSADGVHLRDEGSRNGTWISGTRLSEAVLTADAELELGSTRMTLRLESDEIDLPLSASPTFGQAIGVSVPMRHLFAMLERIAPSDVTVLLEGESGVGKEVLARAIHAASPRRGGPFVTFDCGAVPAGLIESQLFGHERGAYTGAVESRRGVFEEASGGTIFLDEIGELPLDLQPKLLRVLEEREVRPLGSRGPRRVDVRIIAATNRRLAEAARNDEFRRDLFYRLAVARLTIPPLRERREDIEPIARSFLRTVKRDPGAELPPQLAAMLASYPWPGNVRELRNVVERYALLGASDAAALFDVTAPHAGGVDDLLHLPYHEARRVALDRFERSYVPKLLERAGGVVARAAEAAQIARPSFYRILERLRLPGAEES